MIGALEWPLETTRADMQSRTDFESSEAFAKGMQDPCCHSSISTGLAAWAQYLSISNTSARV